MFIFLLVTDYQFIKQHETRPATDNSPALQEYSPICDRWYKSSHSIFHDVVPRRAYYDNRTLASGQPRNMVIVITEMLDSKAVADSVLCCELNGYFSNVTIRYENTCKWVRQHIAGYTHCSAYIQCTGFPKAAISSGSIVKVIYKKETDACYSRVATEKPLTIMNTGFTAGKETIVVCSAFFGKPPFFNEWLKYQKALGVDRVHLSVEKSFSNNAMVRHPFLKEQYCIISTHPLSRLLDLNTSILGMHI